MHALAGVGTHQGPSSTLPAQHRSGLECSSIELTSAVLWVHIAGAETGPVRPPVIMALHWPEMPPPQLASVVLKQTVSFSTPRCTDSSAVSRRTESYAAIHCDRQPCRTQNLLLGNRAPFLLKSASMPLCLQCLCYAGRGKLAHGPERSRSLQRPRPCLQAGPGFSAGSHATEPHAASC